MVSCDNCRSTPEGSRIICIDCFDQTTSVDFCSKQECVNSTVTFGDSDRKPHLPSHCMFKVHRYLFNKDRERLNVLAANTLGYARMTLLQLKMEGKPLLGCVSCKASVSMPCWYCTECNGASKPATIETSLTSTRPYANGGHSHMRRLRRELPRLQRQSHDDARYSENLRGR